MTQGDSPVKVSSQEVSLRQDLTQTIAVPNPVSEVFFTQGLPRLFVNLNQTSAGPAALIVKIEWAIRLNAAGTPDFVLLQNQVLVPGGLTPANVFVQTGALAYRFSATVPGGLETVQILATAFV